ncbi:MAG: hypothetical protein IJC87_03975 [Clostridia bacterium]|nr:hypothetical protein [Clostridia bacterium]
MKKTKEKRLLQLPISIVLLCVTFLGCGVITWFSGVDYWFWLLLIPSVFVIVQLTSVCHEFGHYIATVKSGFEVYYFKCSIFTVDKYGRRKFRISLFGEHLGEIRFYPKKEVDYCSALKKSLWGGLIGGIIIAIALNLVLCLALLGVFGKVASPYISLIFSFSPYATYSLVINAIAWFHPENDASKIIQIKQNAEQKTAINNFYTVQKRLFDGKTYAEIPSEYFLIGENASLDVKLPLSVYALRKAIEEKDLETAQNLAENIESYGDLNREICCELLYLFVVLGNAEKARKYESVFSLDLDENEPYVLRAKLARLKFIGDERYFNVLKPTALKVCERKTFCKGDVIYNQKLIENL